MRYVAIPAENRFNREQVLPSNEFIGIASAAATASMASAPSVTGSPISTAAHRKGRVLDTINTEKGVDALLLELNDAERLDLHTEYPDLRLVPEGEARMAMAWVELQPLSFASMTGTVATTTLTIRVRGSDAKPIRGARVQLVFDEKTKPPTGSSGVTDAKGETRFPVPQALKKAAYLRVEPAHTYWFAGIMKPAWSGKTTLDVICPIIQDDVSDALAEFGGAGRAGDGAGVVVAVIDGGAGPHAALPSFGGANLSIPANPSDDLTDNGIGHGTHVAGIIAGQGGPGGITGMAPGVSLRVYRIYGKNDYTVKAFPVAAAIRRAIDDGADLINLSLTLTVEDLAVIRQLQAARAKGSVCIAAAGNNGGSVMMPARHDASIGVSALGAKNGWPKGAEFGPDVRAKPKGSNRKHFVASFSCFGPEIDLAGPGVGIVSLYPKARRAVMNGTSMATPAVTGLIARLLARNPHILQMPRDQARSDAIVQLALKSASSMGFPAPYQGRGVPA